MAPVLGQGQQGGLLSSPGVGWGRRGAGTPAKTALFSRGGKYITSSGKPRPLSVALPSIWSLLICWRFLCPISLGHPSSVPLPESTGRDSLVKEPGLTLRALSAAQGTAVPSSLGPSHWVCCLYCPHGLQMEPASQEQVDIRVLHLPPSPQGHPVSCSHCSPCKAPWKLK